MWPICLDGWLCVGGWRLNWQHGQMLHKIPAFTLDPCREQAKWGGFLLPACPGAHLMVSSMDWLSRSWNWPQLAHPLVQEEMDAKHGTNMDWNKMVQTNYPTGCYVQNVLWPEVATGIFSSSPHCVGGKHSREFMNTSWQKCPTKHYTREKGYILLPKQLLSYLLLLHSWGQGSDGAHNMVK